MSAELVDIDHVGRLPYCGINVAINRAREVQMYGRRSHTRYAVDSGAGGGVLLVGRDVLLEQSANHEVVVLSRQAGVIGEPVHIEIVDRGSIDRQRMRVVESRPAMIDGTLWHRLRLQPLEV